MAYEPDPQRYNQPDGWFRRCGRSGLKLPQVSLGCWHNFGDAGTDSQGTANETDMHENCRQMLFSAFDRGITHFDLANNYGPPPGAAEERVGEILHQDFASHRDELIVASKAGYGMWDGPYGDGGSRKYLIASCDQSLKRLKLDYVDIFYHHRPDPATPMEETMGALDAIVRSGKALYAGLSNYGPEDTRRAMETCEANGYARPIINQVSYSLLNPWVDNGLADVCDELGLGIIAFCPLQQGLLPPKYLYGIPADSRAANEYGALGRDGVSDGVLIKVRALNEIAQHRGQSLTHLALQWVTRRPVVVSALIGASRADQVEDSASIPDDDPLTENDIAACARVLSR
ncbi:MAG: aldo/keto reductase [Verrucomicrobia bacterium]|nr:aldo/keto reductase [Verrucomicrobiota bacterium]